MYSLFQYLDELIKIKLCMKVLYKETPEFLHGAVMFKDKQILDLLCIMILKHFNTQQYIQEVNIQTYMCFQLVTN
jgi:hypothetical protein